MGGEGAAKIEDIPPYCTRTLYTGPPGQGRRGSWHILGSLFRSGRGGEGDVTREGGPPGGRSGPGLGAWSSVPCWSRLLPQSLLSDVPPLARPPASILASEGPPWLLGSLYSPPSLEGPRGGYGFSEAPPGALSLVLTQGKGCVWQKQLYRHGCRGGAPPSHLESLLMTRIRAAFSSLSRWLSARRSDRACEAGRRVSRVALGRLYPRPTLALCPQLPASSHLQLLLQFGCLSLQGPALLE